MAKPSIQKIAEMANVSTTTVSYVINNKAGISPATRDKILRIMDELNYTPVGDRRRHIPESKHIFLVSDEYASFGNLFYAAIFDIISSASAKFGYDIVVSNKTESFQESTAAAAIRNGMAAGVIFLHDLDAEMLVFLKNSHVPFVVIDGHRTDPGYSRVCFDYELATYTATKHLIELGHTKIGFIGERAIPDFYTSTFNGFCRALSEHHLTVHPSWLQAEAWDIDSAYQCMNNILEFNEHPTGIVCSTDQFALAGMHCAQKAGYQIPTDFSFIGIDDLNISRVYVPALTTVRIDQYEMAERAMEFITKQISAKSPDIEQVYTLKSNKLIVRDSTAAPKE